MSLYGKGKVDAACISFTFHYVIQLDSNELKQQPVTSNVQPLIGFTGNYFPQKTVQQSRWVVCFFVSPGLPMKLYIDCLKKNKQKKTTQWQVGEWAKKEPTILVGSRKCLSFFKLKNWVFSRLSINFTGEKKKGRLTQKNKAYFKGCCCTLWCRRTVKKKKKKLADQNRFQFGIFQGYK